MRQLARRARILGLGPAALSGVFLIAVLLFAAVAQAAGPYGQGTEYRTLFDPEGSWSFLDPRVLIWIFAQLHLLFAAFVLAVPMFVLIIEVVGILSKDAEQSKRYDDLAHEFCRLLATAFSVTAILGAIFTFLCLGLYPKMFGYLVEVFGPSMYLYALIFFGESFSLYMYYYGWGKFKRWTHAMLGVALNVFGVSLMLIANAWTTFTMSPGGIDDNGALVDRSAAFFNYLLHPINIHRLIANLCMGGSVAAAYAAYKFLTTTDPAKRAHYDWMGYIGNFIAILALLPLPFAGYYLGFEIYGFNQQLGIYMMGGVLSWLFIMQAVLVGALFFAANYYLWLGMDRIEGSERYRGWIKWMLGVITVMILVWATPKSLIMTSAEIERVGGMSHPVLGVLGVMSAKNTAVNLIILTTFLSFVLYRRGNKVPTVPWANVGKIIQTGAFGIAAAVVVFIGIGGYVPELWLESTKRVAMSPWQVLTVLACILIVMPIDILMFKNAREIGKIRWGQVSRRSQYTLFFLAVSFTWLMALMGFVRSSLRQHWHVYEVLEDKSPWAYTPAIGYATIIVTVVVMLFFLLVSMVAYLGGLGVHEEEEEREPAPKGKFPARVAGAAVLGVAALLVMVGGRNKKDTESEAAAEARSSLSKQNKALGRYGVIDAGKGVYQVPVSRAFELLQGNPDLMRAVDAQVSEKAPEDMTPEERGKVAFDKYVQESLRRSGVAAHQGGRTAMVAYKDVLSEAEVADLEVYLEAVGVAATRAEEQAKAEAEAAAEAAEGAEGDTDGGTDAAEADADEADEEAQADPDDKPDPEKDADADKPGEKPERTKPKAPAPEKEKAEEKPAEPKPDKPAEPEPEKPEEKDADSPA